MSDFESFWMDRNDAAGTAGTYCNAQNFGIIQPSVNALYGQFIQPHETSKNGFVIKASTYLKLIDASGEHFVFGSEADVSVGNAEQRLDAGTALQAGRDYYIYLCRATNASGETAAEIKVSLNSTYPSGHNAYTSRKIGGFHTLCADVGAISGHPLSGYVAGEILPASFWCLSHRPTCNPEGMVYIKAMDIWADIYLQSGTGTATTSVNGGTITDSQTYSQHIEDMFMVGKSPLSDEEFQCAAEGSNQMTVIAGGADPVTTGGHKDTAGRRMISNYGLEDCAGAMYQWLSGWSYRPTELDGDAAIVWIEDPSGKGSVYRTNAFLAGGSWNNGTYCGSRSRSANFSRLRTIGSATCRGRARSQVAR